MKQVKFCLHCGRDISCQIAKSKYCSDKHFGSHNCRQQGYERRKINRSYLRHAIKSGLKIKRLFVINGETHSSILTPKKSMLNDFDFLDVTLTITPISDDEQH